MRLMSYVRNRAFVQLARYTLVSALALVVDFSALVALTELFHVHYLSSAALAFGLGVATNYALSVIWVFDTRAVKYRWAEFLGFALLGVIGLGLNEAMLLVLSSWFGIHYSVAKLAATGLTFAWNFVSRKLLLFTPAGTTAAESPCAPDVAGVDPVAMVAAE